MNFFRTMLLLSALTALFMAIGYAIGGGPGMTIAFMIAAATNLFAYWNSDKMVLSQQGAEEVDEAQAPELYGIVRQLAANAGLPMPRVYIIHTDQPNAFATGRNPENAAVAASSGLLRMMSKEEIAGVLGHELAHVKNRDTLTMTIAATIAGAISMLANFGMFFGGSRRDGEGRDGRHAARDHRCADCRGAVADGAQPLARIRRRSRRRAISGHPLWLASALQKIERAAHEIPNEQAEDHPASASLYIINPLTGGGMDNLFSTHPNTENRIAALQEQAQEMGEMQGPSGGGIELPPMEGRDEPGEPGPWGAGRKRAARRGAGLGDDAWRHRPAELELRMPVLIIAAASSPRWRGPHWLASALRQNRFPPARESTPARDIGALRFWKYRRIAATPASRADLTDHRTHLHPIEIDTRTIAN